MGRSNLPYPGRCIRILSCYLKIQKTSPALLTFSQGVANRVEAYSPQLRPYPSLKDNTPELICQSKK